MDNYYSSYGSDQYVVDMSAPFPSRDVRASKPSNSQIGYYEDELRYSQYGVPAHLRCKDPNPYIQDDIRKSQRHYPIRKVDVPERSEVVASTSCEPCIDPRKALQLSIDSNNAPFMHGAKCSVAPSENKLHLVVESGKCSSCENFSGKEKMISSDSVFTVDGSVLFMIFIFIVIICMCFYYWKSMGDIKETLALLREMIRNKNN